MKTLGLWSPGKDRAGGGLEPGVPEVGRSQEGHRPAQAAASSGRSLRGPWGPSGVQRLRPPSPIHSPLPQATSREPGPETILASAPVREAPGGTSPTRGSGSPPGAPVRGCGSPASSLGPEALGAPPALRGLGCGQGASTGAGGPETTQPASRAGPRPSQGRPRRRPPGAPS